MIDKKVVVVATGGTIAMKYDPEKDGLVPACTGEDLAAAVPGLGEVAPLEFIQFSNIASPGMTPQNMWDLHLKLEEVLARDDVAGAIVTHGTDTLEETSYFLDLPHQPFHRQDGLCPCPCRRHARRGRHQPGRSHEHLLRRQNRCQSGSCRHGSSRVSE